MSNFADRFADAKEHLRPVDWSLARRESLRARIAQRRRRFTLSTVALGSAAIAVAVAVAIVLFAQGGAPAQKAVATQGQIELRDGTRAVELGTGSALRLVHEGPEQVSFALDAGKGWFEVTPSATRRVEVSIKDVKVEVLGTEFVVEVQGEFVHVWVHRGRVQVSSEAGTVVLAKGQDRRFRTKDETAKGPGGSVDAGTPRADEDEDEDEIIEEVEDIEETVEKLRVRDVQAQEPELPAVVPSPDPAQDEVSVLWRRADAARRRGKHDDAIAALTALLNDHGDDPRSALAAFSLGRVLVDAHRSPRVAARAFAKARKLSPEGPLVEDALLREVEAWHDAGDTRRVQKRTEKYLRLFPRGRYRNQLREMGTQP